MEVPYDVYSFIFFAWRRISTTQVILELSNALDAFFKIISGFNNALSNKPYDVANLGLETENLEWDKARRGNDFEGDG